MLGQTCAPLALPDNRVLAVYRASPESGRRGLWATTARIEGTDWVEEGEDFCLWGEEQEVNHLPDERDSTGQLTSDTPADGCVGQAMPGAKHSGITEMIALKFGFPQLIQLADGDVLVVFVSLSDRSVVVHTRSYQGTAADTQ